MGASVFKPISIALILKGEDVRGLKLCSSVGPHSFSCRGRHPGRRRPDKPAVSSLIDRLEGRVLLSSYIVTNILDSGPGSLRDAFQTGALAITFSVTGTIKLTNGALDIAHDVQIIGPGSNSLTI